jgi:hypothetical protein
LEIGVAFDFQPVVVALENMQGVLFLNQIGAVRDKVDVVAVVARRQDAHVVAGFDGQVGDGLCVFHHMFQPYLGLRCVAYDDKNAQFDE